MYLAVVAYRLAEADQRMNLTAKQDFFLRYSPLDVLDCNLKPYSIVFRLVVSIQSEDNFRVVRIVLVDTHTAFEQVSEVMTRLAVVVAVGEADFPVRAPQDWNNNPFRL